MSTKRKFKYIDNDWDVLKELPEGGIVDENFTWGTRSYTVGQIVDGKLNCYREWEEIPKRKFKYVGPYADLIDRLPKDRIVDEDFPGVEGSATVSQIVSTWGSEDWEEIKPHKEIEIDYEEAELRTAKASGRVTKHGDGYVIGGVFPTRESYENALKSLDNSRLVLETAKSILPRLVAKQNTGYSQPSPESIVKRAFDIAEEFKNQADVRKLI